jgi:hypothetical protein
VHNNSDVFKPAVVNVSINELLPVSYMAPMLATIARTAVQGAIEPYFVCNSPSILAPAPVTCVLGNITSCASLNCTLFYSEQDASAGLAGRTLKVCGIAQQFQSVAYFSDPRNSQPRALLDVIEFPGTGPVPQDYCSTAEWEKLNDYSNPRGPVFTGRWVRSCDVEGESIWWRLQQCLQATLLSGAVVC